MKICIFFLALFQSVFILAQDSEPSNYNMQDATLCIGDIMQLDDKSIKFKKVISDSRCPKGVTCVWAGEVKILIEFYEQGKFKGDKIITGSNISIEEFFNVKDLIIKTLVVYPYPEINEKISSEEYSLSLKISERVSTD
ncbi:hypothetical protein [Christiangramia sediminis]|uniref:Uncharacterized protein n=1 Tax=Christiangramia sediminis TaxID=2881336 RepID=A0A9X1RYK2_9FLAO|nr:hypothetical protein [Christiangramia sediminis]MCB7481804.1 hypothetical protein [Christiangramia sediminis]